MLLISVRACRFLLAISFLTIIRISFLAIYTSKVIYKQKGVISLGLIFCDLAWDFFARLYFVGIFFGI